MLRPRKSETGFTLVEIMIVLAITGIIVAIAAPTWFRQREISRAISCQENLYKIYGAAEQYALEFRLNTGAPINYPTDLVQPGGVAVGQGYLRSNPDCPASGVYSLAAVGQTPTCSIGTSVTGFPPHTFEGR
jgi:prepilin-type N-terminal cleavage/methylation domain-containing protein